MRHNQRIAHFLDKLAAAGVSYRVLWSARRDGKKGSDDVHFVSFTGDGFRPAVGTAVIIDYGRDGYGFFPESPHASIDDDVFRVSSTRDHPMPVPVARRGAR